ncbi:MAG: hypothetical protein ABL891_09300 [Burkholderiales bacterium]
MIAVGGHFLNGGKKDSTVRATLVGESVTQGCKVVLADSILTTHAGYALTSLCRVEEMVIDTSAQTARTDQFSIGGNIYTHSPSYLMIFELDTLQKNNREILD